MKHALDNLRGMIGKLAHSYVALLRIEALFGLGFFAGCAFTGFLVGIGHFH